MCTSVPWIGSGCPTLLPSARCVPVCPGLVLDVRHYGPVPDVCQQNPLFYVLSEAFTVVVTGALPVHTDGGDGACGAGRERCGRGRGRPVPNQPPPRNIVRNAVLIQCVSPEGRLCSVMISFSLFLLSGFLLHAVVLVIPILIGTETRL